MNIFFYVSFALYSLSTIEFSGKNIKSDGITNFIPAAAILFIVLPMKFFYDRRKNIIYIYIVCAFLIFRALFIYYVVGLDARGIFHGEKTLYVSTLMLICWSFFAKKLLYKNNN